jgi:hypothetical protein
LEILDQEDGALLTRASFVNEPHMNGWFFETRDVRDIESFLNRVLGFSPNKSCQDAFKTYKDCLKTIANNLETSEDTKERAKEALQYREATFRTYFFKVEKVVMDALNAASQDRKRARAIRPYENLLGDDLPSSAESDDSAATYVCSRSSSEEFEPSSSCSSEYDGEIHMPVYTDFLVGPGTVESELSDDMTGRTFLAGCDVSKQVMSYRRANVIKKPPQSEQNIM